jgi:hypothetical protein
MKSYPKRDSFFYLLEVINAISQGKIKDVAIKVCVD